MTEVRSQRSDLSKSIALSPLLFALTLASALLFALCLSAEAQQPKKIPRIGFLSALSPKGVPAWLDAFRQGLKELGYIEGKNIVVERRFAEGKLNRLPSLASELVSLKLDVIVSAGPAVTRATKEATSTIPIVMGFDNDPVGSGFVASLARPGGNITGLSNFAPEMSAKRLELLKEIVPKLSRVAVLGASTQPGNAQMLKETELAAGTFGLQLQYLDILSPKDIESVFRSARNGRADAILMLSIPFVLSHRTQLADLAIKSKLPTIYSQPENTEAGGLMYYGVNTPDLFRRTATYVDKILKGTKPAGLPVEQPRKFELVINLNAAKQIGLTMPQSVLYRADKVIR